MISVLYKCVFVSLRWSTINMYAMQPLGVCHMYCAKVRLCWLLLAVFVQDFGRPLSNVLGQHCHMITQESHT